jgi:hypothetical protein
MRPRAWAWALGAAAAAVALCAGAAPEVTRITPDGPTPVRAERYTGRDGTYRMPFPDLGPKVSVRDTMVNANAGWAEFTGGDGAALYVVSVRLGAGPRDARELDAVRRRYADFARQLPDRFTEWSGRTRFGPGYGFTLLNADPVQGYPVQLGYRPANEVQTVAVHRFFVHGGVLYEIAALAQRRGAAATLPPSALAARAEGIADAALKTFEPLKTNPPNAPEKK